MKSWVLLVVGLLLGMAGGLVYTWVLAPPQYYNTYPPLLQLPYRQDWIRMTALAYGADGNWDRAQLRLRDLSEVEVRRVTAQVLEEAVSKGRSIAVLQHLAKLAQAYGVDSPAVHIYAGGGAPAPTPIGAAPAVSPTATPTTAPPTATSTVTPSPSPTLPPLFIGPTPQPPSPYKVISQTLTCASPPTISVSLVVSHSVKVRGREKVELEGLPVQAVWLIWDEGADRALTGFRPEFGLGYADFVVEPGRVYKLYIVSPTGVPISTLMVEPCAPEEGGGWVSRSLTILKQGDQ